nr:RNA-directed DNA polymerase, eukaryota [Tanacetum cinerariifolium]
MESLHISFSRASSDGFFKGIQIKGSIIISHLFYADDVMFIGKWSDSNLKNVVKILNCLYYASGLKIIIDKSQLLGVGVPRSTITQAVGEIGCMVLNHQFRYLGVMVGELMSRRSAWDDTVNKIRSRLSNWKVKTLSIGGRLTLLKSVLGTSTLYYMSIFKTPKGVLKEMEAIRSKFFNGTDTSERKITWIAWQKALASKIHGGLGISSFYALNRALLLKWRVGDGLSTRFWLDIWVSEFPLKGCAWWSRTSTMGRSAIFNACFFRLRVIDGYVIYLEMGNIGSKRICRWWDLDGQNLTSFSDWQTWFLSIQLPSKTKMLLEGVFYVAWWYIWGFRNQSVFDESPPRCSVIFDDIVSFYFNWCFSRCYRFLSWDSWHKTPHLISL